MFLDPLPYRKDIANRVRKLIRDGVKMSVILDSIQDLQDAPRSMSTLYKIYGNDIAKERAEFQSYLGSKAMQRIEEGSDRILELALKSKAGWNPTETVNIGESDDFDEDTSAIDELLTILGKRNESSDNGEDTEEPS